MCKMCMLILKLTIASLLNTASKWADKNFRGDF
jgi:hypothetical protein